MEFICNLQHLLHFLKGFVPLLGDEIDETGRGGNVNKHAILIILEWV